MGIKHFTTTPERSLLMSKIKGRDTKPELRLRKALWAIGLRYRVHNRSLPGRPDISIKKYKIVIFVDGSFWHGKDWNIKKQKIKNNSAYWIAKIERNMERDTLNENKLKDMGYTVIRFWDSEIEKALGHCIKTVLDFINLKNYGELYEQ